MSVASKGLRYARCGPITTALKLESFNASCAADSDVILKVTHAPIHRTDAAVINGTGLGRQVSTQATAEPVCKKAVFPRIGGFEGIGVVEDAGRNARVKKGDTVWISPTASVGSWATHVTANGEHLHVVPKGVDLNLAACATAIITGRQLITNRDLGKVTKDVAVLVNGGSSLTALAATAYAAKAGATVIAAAEPGARFSAAKSRLTAAGATAVVEYTPAGARAAKAAAGTKRIALFANGVGGRSFNDFAKLVQDGTCVTYGAQNSFGLMWAGSNQFFRNIDHVGFFAPRFLGNLSYEQRQAVFEASITGAKLDYPTVAIKSFEDFEAAWDQTYLEGGKKHLFVF